MVSPTRSPGSLLAILLALFVLALPLLAPSAAHAQFGKNKVQYKEFDWYTIETEHFDIYYYDEEKESAKIAARMAERAYSRLSRILNHEVERRIPVIVYASHTDFQQTNITPGHISEGTGGITEYSKRRVFLPFTGSYGEFDHVLSHELVHAFQVDLMFGAGPESNPFTSRLPLWFMEGMAEYLSVGHVDSNTEMWLRWSALEGQLIPLQYMDRINDIRVYRIGQAIFSFVGEQFGDEKIGEILRSAVLARSVDVGFESALGMDLRTLNKDWEDYVKRKYYPQIVDLNRPEEHARRLLEKEGFTGVHVAPSLSPDGNRLVYIKQGRFSKNIELASAIDGKDLGTILKGERSGDFESLRYMYTAIGWSPDGNRIAFPSKTGGEDVLYIMDVDRRKVLAQLRFSFDAIYSPAYHPNGQEIVFSAIRGGKSNLYLTNLQGSELIQLTDTDYMARDPQFSPDGTRIAFVTDEGEDTDLENLVFGEPRIAILEVETGEINLMSGQLGKNIAPYWGPKGNHIAFVSDRDGISNLYVQNLRDDRLYRLTKLVTGVTGLIGSSPPFSWSRDGKRIVFTTFMGDGWELYGIDDPIKKMEEVETPEPLERIAKRERESIVPWDAPSLFAVQPATPSPARPRPLSDASAVTAAGDGEGMVVAVLAKAELADRESDAIAGNVVVAEVADVEGEEEESEGLADLLALPTSGLGLAGPGAPVSRAYAWDDRDDADRAMTLAQVIRETTYDLPDPESLEGSPYRLRWSPDFIGASPFFASNVGFAGSATVAISDILSNHVIQIGVSVYGSIDESDLFLGYYNLQGRTNWGAALFQYRNDFGIFTAQDRLGYESQIFRGAQVSISRPFSQYSRIEVLARGVAVSERVFEQSFSGTGFVTTNETGSDLIYYAGPEIAFVSDTTLWGYSGPVHGRRMRLSVEQAFGDIQFNTVLLDYRKYFSFGATVLATRVIGGSSNGNTPQLFRVGGPYTVRGYGYGEFEGENIVLLNTELRFPLVESLSLRWPLRIGLGGIGGVLFFDAGSAFTDTAQLMNSGALDDSGAGYGFGFRLGLGYFSLKYDFSWRTDLKRTDSEYREDFTIGVDF